MEVQLLDKIRHDRSRFDCGVEPLNRYLKLMANQQGKRDNARTYVLEDSGNPSNIVGFYTLTLASIDLSFLPSSIRKKHQTVTSAGLIARLAVDKRFKGQGFGEWLLVDALKKLLSASDVVGFPLVVVDAKDGAREFYLQYGFTAFNDIPNKLYITVSDIRASLR